MKTSLGLLMLITNSLFILNGITLYFNTGDYLSSLLVNLLMYVLPGMGWIGILKNRLDDRIATLFWIFSLSTGIHLVVHGVHVLFGIQPEPLHFLLAVAALTNIGFLVSQPQDLLVRFKNHRMQTLILSLACLCVFSCIYTGMKTLPEQIDLDGEHQGTAYGFMYELKPYLTSDIVASPYYFAHPPLSNLYNAYSAFYLNTIHDYKFYYTTAKSTDQILALKVGGQVEVIFDGVKYSVHKKDDQYFELQATGDAGLIQLPYEKDQLIQQLSKTDQSEFYRRPRVFPTRASNLSAAVITYLVLFQLIVCVTNSRLLGFVGGFIFIFSPGIFVRTCFSEHVAFTNCIMAWLAYQYVRPEAFRLKAIGRVSGWAYLPGIVAGLVNQKIIILIVPLFFLEVFKRFNNMRQSPADTRRSSGLEIVIGFTIGTLMFWIYGLAIDQQAFIVSHLQTHLFDRIVHQNTMFAADYPSVGQLWREFYKEFPLVILALLGILLNIKKIVSDRIIFLLLWIIFGAISFTIVDWKQTNHLMLIVMPLIVLLMNYIEQHKIGYKRFLKILIGLSLVYSFWIDLQLMQDFSVYAPTSGW